jgi:DNA primase
MSAESLARALEARRSGSSWMAKCPAHEDRNPSLSIREVDGKVLLHCHAGCTTTRRNRRTEGPRVVAAGAH